MSDTMLSLVILLAQVGGVLLLIALVMSVRFIFSSSKQGEALHALVKSNKSFLPRHRSQLEKFFHEKMDEEKIKSTIKTLITDEETVHGRCVKVALTKSPESLKMLGKDIDSLINHYVELLNVSEEKEIIAENSGEKKSEKLILKQENSKLKDEISSLESKLQVSADTIDNMLSEFANMYSANDEEKEKNVKNNAYKLNKKIEEEANIKNQKKINDEQSEQSEQKKE
ncbi:MAG: hypothetical protein QM484_08525 [Woeseiaceae bacterium]